MVHVVRRVTRGPDVLHDVDTTRLERTPNALQHLKRLRLVVYGVEGGDGIPGLGFSCAVEVREIRAGERHVCQVLRPRMVPGIVDGFGRQVHPLKCALREQLRQPVDDEPAAAPHVEQTNPGFKPGPELRHQRQHVRFERREHRLAAVLRHDRMEPWKPLVRHAATPFKAFDDVVFDAAEERNVLGECGEVVGTGSPRQDGRVLWREGVAVTVGMGLHLHDPGGGHGAKPLPHIALVQPGPLRQPGWGHRREIAHGVESPQRCPTEAIRQKPARLNESSIHCTNVSVVMSASFPPATSALRPACL